MARGLGRRRIARGLFALLVLARWGLHAPPATALEAFDGRLQAHGFVEINTRAINSAWKEQTDLTQWYNILNVEFEADIAPDGFGPIDLLSAYVRVEARYDCIYSKGCGMFPSVSTFGNRSRSLPDRLSDATLKDFAGTIPVKELVNGEIVSERPVLPSRDPATPDELATFEGLFESLGGDPLAANLQSDPLDPTDSFFVEPNPPNDDPARYTLEAVLDYKFAAKDLRSASTTGAFALLAPWIPRNKPIDSNGALVDKANPYRGRAAPVIQGAAVRTRFYEGDPDPRLASNGGSLVPTNRSGGPAYIDPRPIFDPAFLPLLETEAATDRSGTPYTELVRSTIDVVIPPDQVAAQQVILDELFATEGLEDPAMPGQPLTADTVSPVTQTDGPYDLFNVFVVETEAREADGITPLDLPGRRLRAGYYIRVDPSVDPSTLVGTFLQGSSRVITAINRVIPQFQNANREGFGGDFSNIIPFFPGDDPDGNFPNGPACAADADTYIQDAFRCPNGVDAEGRSNSAQNSIDGISVSGGSIPLRNVFISGGAGELPLRPAPDLSVLDTAANPDLLLAQGIYYPSAGLRHALMTQDFDDHQFDVGENRRAWNRGASQDQTKELKEAYFDIETLESRLWMRIGRQNIVWGKTELFRTTDQFNPIDLALASLPTLEEQRIPVWSAKAIYSVYDLGPLQDVRLEFATNFDEFTPSDLGACGEPYTIDIICGVTFGLAAHGFAGLGIAGVDRPPDPWNDIKGLEVGGRIEWRWDRFSFALIDFYGYNDTPFPDPLFFYERNVDLDTGRPVVTRFVGGKPGAQTQGGCATPSPGTFDVEVADGASPVPLPFDASKSWRSTSPLGIGTESPCLKAGGAAGFQAENAFDAAENALYHHASNQQIHAFACSATLGVSSLDVQRCALALFGSPNFLQGGVVPFPLIEFFSIALSGEPATQAFVIAATGTVRVATAEGGKPAPLVGLNRDRGPICDPDTGAPFATPAECVAALQAGGWDGIITASNATINVPDPDAPMAVPFFNPETQMTELKDCTLNLARANDGPCRVFSFHYNPGTSGVPGTDGDFLTLDSTLSNEQKALLGCGPFFGTRCDSSDVVEEFFDASFPDCDSVAPGEPCAGAPADVPLTPQGGGIDLFNADASFFLQSWAGIEGTGPEFYTPRLLAAFDAAEQERVDTLIPLCRDNTGPPAQPRFCRVYRPLVDLGGVRPVPQRFLEPLGPTWLTTATSLIQPQTIRLGEYSDAFGTVQPAGSSFPNAQPCTVYNESDGTLDVLPGCRGIESIAVPDADAGGPPSVFTVTFQEGYLPSVDGCVFGGSGGVLDIGGVPVVALDSEGVAVSGQLKAELESCADDSTLTENSNTRVHDFGLPVGARERFGVPTPGAQALFHPLAGCLPDEDAASLDPRRNTCPFGLVLGETPRDFAAELAGTDPSGRGPENVFLFRSEGAAMSFNVQMFLAALSCNGDPEADIMVDPECFDPEDSFSPARCSFAAPQFCENVKGLLGVAGVQRNTVKAGGTNGFGRRSFLWQSGGEVALRYNRRNVLGFSMDFAEDVTKTNWGMEFTWVGDTTVIDSNSPTNVRDVQTYNLTVSVDRPTFINFLNPNRTFFFNTQWFFQYVTNYHGSMPSTGPFNVLFTFAVLAGYFQDRLLPQFISIYDFQSQSGGFLPSVQYRFTENLSATIGMLFFFGQTDFNKVPIRGFAPAGNRAGPNAYREPEENFISLIRDRDEVFLRLRWTF